MMHQRESHRRNTFQTPFEDSTHSTGINNIDTGIGAVVDACKHYIGTARQYISQGKLHTVYRCAVYSKQPNALRPSRELGYAQRHIDTECRRLAGMWMCRSDDIHIAHRFHTIGKMMYAESVHTVVVSYKYKFS